jgi:hypothetical protein
MGRAELREGEKKKRLYEFDFFVYGIFDFHRIAISLFGIVENSRWNLNSLVSFSSLSVYRKYRGNIGKVTACNMSRVIPAYS